MSMQTTMEQNGLRKYLPIEEHLVSPSMVSTAVMTNTKRRRNVKSKRA